jgi:hypothetical protein
MTETTENKWIELGQIELRFAVDSVDEALERAHESKTKVSEARRLAMAAGLSPDGLYNWCNPFVEPRGNGTYSVFFDVQT